VWWGKGGGPAGLLVTYCDVWEKIFVFLFGRMAPCGGLEGCDSESARRGGRACMRKEGEPDSSRFLSSPGEGVRHPWGRLRAIQMFTLADADTLADACHLAVHPRHPCFVFLGCRTQAVTVAVRAWHGC
jgi:hypothetical protein